MSDNTKLLLSVAFVIILVGCYVWIFNSIGCSNGDEIAKTSNVCLLMR